MKFDHRFGLIEAGPGHRIYGADGVLMRLDFLPHMLRVALIRDGVPLVPTWSVCPRGADVPLAGRDKLSVEGFTPLAPAVTEADGTLCFALDGVDFSIELKNFRISARTEKGLLYRDRSGLAYNFAGELGAGSVHYADRFDGEEIFGLGDKCGPVNKAGQRFLLHTGDAMGFRAESSDPLYKHLPFYLCRHGAGSYGLFYDTLSRGAMDLGREHDNYFEPFRSVRFEEENLVFYLILGTPMEIIRRFSALTGMAAPVPKWAFSYCGSTMAYTDAPDADRQLRGFVTRCEENGIPCRGFYLSSGYTQIGDRRCVFYWNLDKIPSPEGLSSYFRDHGMALIPNVKPAFLTDHPLYETIAANGWFLRCADGRPAQFPFWGGMASYLDFTNPDAYAFWKRCVKEQLIDKGYTDIWNDNNEYDVWDDDVLAYGFGHPLPASRVRPLFSYLMARASREACLEAGVETPFNVSRCAMAGTERVASTWTGDNLTDFRDLRFNHYQAMTMALSGFLFFGPDIGGFAGPQPGRELFLRWLQYGVFLPRFVLHSWKPGAEPTMPWLYPGLLPAVRRLFALRERLVPYLYEQAEQARLRREPLIRPVFLLDDEYPVESDWFMCGEDILVCPVFDEGAVNVALTLPKLGGGWRLRGQGPLYPPGEELIVPCLAEDEPVWFVKA
ncbi:MAG: alpha-glucosidase [Clostridia bacterium]|nr:alpha-glucosidase [Clostridia bacterium]